MSSEAFTMRNTTKILTELRALMKQLPKSGGAISAYIIPTDDSHQSEYISPADERRSFVSGFDGSAGTAIVTQDAALLWTDGRYHQQAEKQIDGNWTLMKDGLPATPTIGNWLVNNLSVGARVGVDGNLLSFRIWNPLASELALNGMKLESIEPNLIDVVWHDQPIRKFNPILALDTSISGRTIADKVEQIRREMKGNKCTTVVITALDDVAWLFNLRGLDIAYNPVFFSYALITFDDIHLFVSIEQLPSNYHEHLKDNGVEVKLHDYKSVTSKLAKFISDGKGKTWVSATSSYAISALVPDQLIHREISPVCSMKAIKNDVEAKGMTECHVRDGVALCQYFAWLENAVQNGEIVDEISAATKLQQFREKLDKFKGLSFPTISGSGPNGSIIHYQPKADTNRQITVDDMYLCDSGAQFLDGTTDVTRTWHFGKPTKYQIDCYTRVLKGQISLGTAVFPVKTKGMYLDVLARKSLWDVGLNYEHGTGHGVGHFLNVHEGPMGVSSIRINVDDPGLQENMFISNEPGFYENGEFGIRIEDIVQIVPAKCENDFKKCGALTFKTVTMCPIQTKLINIDLMTITEKTHLNDYHATVRDTLIPLLQQQGDQFTIEWLKKETTAI